MPNAETIRRMFEFTGINKKDDTDVVVFRFTTHPFATLPTETDGPPNEIYAQDLLQASDVTRRIWEPGTTQGQASRSFSSVIIANAERQHDQMLARYAFDLRPAVMRTGPVTATRLSEHVSQTFVIDRQPSGNLSQIEFVLRENVQLLNKNLQQNIYGGTNVGANGVDGTADDIGGDEKPWAFGSVREFPLVPVNTPKLIYAAHDGAVHYWASTYDKGAPYTFTGTYVSQAELENDALKPAPGCFKTWMAGGMCRLGSAPLGVVTADFTVGATPADRTAAAGLKAIWLKAGYTLADIELADLTQLDLDTQRPDGTPTEIAFSTLDDPTGEGLSNMIADTHSAFWGANLAGKLRVKRLGRTTGNTVAKIKQGDVIRGKGPEVQSSSDPKRGAPLKALTLQYGRRYVTQNDPNTIDAARRAYLLKDYSNVYEPRPLVGQTYLNAAAPTIRTLFVFEDDARREMLRLLDLREVDRPRVVMIVWDSLALGTVDLGDEVEFSFAAYDLALYGAARVFYVLAVAPNGSENERGLTLWFDPLLTSNLAATDTGFYLQANDGTFLLAGVE